MLFHFKFDMYSVYFSFNCLTPNPLPGGEGLKPVLLVLSPLLPREKGPGDEAFTHME
jgi:hypothetical protein